MGPGLAVGLNRESRRDILRDHKIAITAQVSAPHDYRHQLTIVVGPNIMPLTQDDYYMNIAVAVRKKANCLGRRVGAVIVKENRIISTGYNGTPTGLTNCLDGGCVRCKNKDAYASSVGYDVCICVHAEQNALITAARFGHPIEGAVVYSTLRPCFDCTKAMLQAKISAIYFIHDWQHPEGSLREQYNFAQSKFPGGVRKIDFLDPEADWANNKSPKSARPASELATR